MCDHDPHRTLEILYTHSHVFEWKGYHTDFEDYCEGDNNIVDKVWKAYNDLRKFDEKSDEMDATLAQLINSLNNKINGRYTNGAENIGDFFKHTRKNIIPKMRYFTDQREMAKEYRSFFQTKKPPKWYNISEVIKNLYDYTPLSEIKGVPLPERRLFEFIIGRL
jgi:hypothetical protein